MGQGLNNKVVPINHKFPIYSNGGSVIKVDFNNGVPNSYLNENKIDAIGRTLNSPLEETLFYLEDEDDELLTDEDGTIFSY